MTYTFLGEGSNIAFVIPDNVISDVESALDLIVSVGYETQCSTFVLEKSAFADDFFVLSSGLAGEILQKFVNYHVKCAVVGDFSHYTSKPLKDFIYESNKGNDFFFVSTVREAAEKLSGAK